MGKGLTNLDEEFCNPLRGLVRGLDEGEEHGKLALPSDGLAPAGLRPQDGEESGGTGLKATKQKAAKIHRRRY